MIAVQPPSGVPDLQDHYILCIYGLVAFPLSQQGQSITIPHGRRNQCGGGHTYETATNKLDPKRAETVVVKDAVWAFVRKRSRDVELRRDTLFNVGVSDQLAHNKWASEV